MVLVHLLMSGETLVVASWSGIEGASGESGSHEPLSRGKTWQN